MKLGSDGPSRGDRVFSRPHSRFERHRAGVPDRANVSRSERIRRLDHAGRVTVHRPYFDVAGAAERGHSGLHRSQGFAGTGWRWRSVCCSRNRSNRCWWAERAYAAISGNIRARCPEGWKPARTTCRDWQDSPRLWSGLQGMAGTFRSQLHCAAPLCGANWPISPGSRFSMGNATVSGWEWSHSVSAAGTSERRGRCSTKVSRSPAARVYTALR